MISKNLARMDRNNTDSINKPIENKTATEFATQHIAFNWHG